MFLWGVYVSGEYIPQDQDQPQNPDFSSSHQQSMEKQAWAGETKRNQNHSLEKRVDFHFLESRKISFTDLKHSVNVF